MAKIHENFGRSRLATNLQFTELGGYPWARHQQAGATDAPYNAPRAGNFVFSRLMTEERDGNVFYAEHLLCAPH
jgi:hypothetical protein